MSKFFRFNLFLDPWIFLVGCWIFSLFMKDSAPARQKHERPSPPGCRLKSRPAWQTFENRMNPCNLCNLLHLWFRQLPLAGDLQSPAEQMAFGFVIPVTNHKKYSGRLKEPDSRGLHDSLFALILGYSLLDVGYSIFLFPADAQIRYLNKNLWSQ